MRTDYFRLRYMEQKQENELWYAFRHLFDDMISYRIRTGEYKKHPQNKNSYSREYHINYNCQYKYYDEDQIIMSVRRLFC